MTFANLFQIFGLSATMLLQILYIQSIGGVMCKARKKGVTLMILNSVTLVRDMQMHPPSCQQFLYYLPCLDNSSNGAGLNLCFIPSDSMFSAGPRVVNIWLSTWSKGKDDYLVGKRMDRTSSEMVIQLSHVGKYPKSLSIFV